MKSDSTDSLAEARLGSQLSKFLGSWANAWNQFWFSKRDLMVLGLIRVLVGLIVLYTHSVWTLELSAFLGEDGMLPIQYRELLFGNQFAWSHLDWFGSSSSVLMAVHLAGLVVVALFTVGFKTRWTSVLTALLVISYANRGMGSLFGLDQISGFLCLYLAVGNSGGAFSWDAWAKRKKDVSSNIVDGAGQGSRVDADVRTNIATRLIQIHMCVVYGFAAIGKLQGESWFSGEAIWLAMASYEYQTIDMTWLAGHMSMVAVLTLFALVWELCYPALVWPKLTRPVVLAISIPVHLGIGLCMGMLTFGLIMIVGNLAFVEPSFLRGIFKRRIEAS